MHDRRDLRGLLSEAALRPGRSDGVHLVHGMPGCGKSAVAQAVFAEVTGAGRSEAPSVTGLWVDAANQQSFFGGMLRVAQDLGATQREVDAAGDWRCAPADLVWRCLDAAPEPWLPVIDDLGDLDIVRQPGWLRASPRGTLVVTSRDGDLRRWPVEIVPTTLTCSTYRTPSTCCWSSTARGATSRSSDSSPKPWSTTPWLCMMAGVFLGDQLLEPVPVREYLNHLGRDPAAALALGADPGERNLRRLIGSSCQPSLDMPTRPRPPRSHRHP
jgi:hypothetical protein